MFFIYFFIDNIIDLTLPGPVNGFPVVFDFVTLVSQLIASTRNVIDAYLILESVKGARGNFDLFEENLLKNGFSVKCQCCETWLGKVMDTQYSYCAACENLVVEAEDEYFENESDEEPDVDFFGN